MWRDWADNWSEGATNADCHELNDAVAQGLLELVGQNEERWSQLAEELNALPPESQDVTITRLEELVAEGWGCRSSKFRDSLRRLLHKHREYSDAGWALPPAQVDRLSRLYERLEPPDLLGKFAWLFAWHPERPEPKEDWQEEEEAAAKERLAAVAELAREGDAAFLLEFASKVQEPGFLGWSLGKQDISTELEEALLNAALMEQRDSIRTFIHTFISGRLDLLDWAWAESQLARRTPEQVAPFSCGLPFSARTWRAVAQQDQGSEYWRKVEPRYLKQGDEDAEEAIKELLAVERPWAALSVIASCVKREVWGKSVTEETIAAVLEELATKDPKEEKFHVQQHDYHIRELLGFLAESGRSTTERVARLEWIYLPLFRHRTVNQTTLHKILAREPSFFEEVISLAYKAEGSSANEAGDGAPTAANLSRVEMAFELLRSWRTVPGTTDEGEVKLDALRGWTIAARDACFKACRGTMGSQAIGQVLAFAPADADGLWPTTAVRDLIEELESSEVERGFSIGIRNKRRTFRRAHREGGHKERELAAKYRDWAMALAAWPRTAAVLRKVADGYDSDARREDLDANSQ